MSAYLRNLLKDCAEEDEAKPVIVKKLPDWLGRIQTARPVTYDTTELYETTTVETEQKKPGDASMNKKCYECGEFGHLAKECPTKWKKKLGGRFKESDWCCPMCGNINWDWRVHCNKCSTPKPTGCNAEKRTGRGGGYNEIDEETRKRLQSKRGGDKSKKKSKDKDRSELSLKMDGDADGRIYIGNLPSTTKTEDGGQMEMDDEQLKSKIATHFGQIGRIKKHRRGEFDIRLSGNRRSARLVFEDPHTAPFAINWFHETEFEGKNITVKLRKDTTAEEREEFGEDSGGGGGGRKDGHRGGRNRSEDETTDGGGRRSEEEQDEREMEAELFGYSKRGRGRGKTTVSRGGGGGRGSRRKEVKRRDDGSRSRSRSRSNERRRHRSRSKERRDRRRDRHRDRDDRRDRDKTYRSSKTSRGYR